MSDKAAKGIGCFPDGGDSVPDAEAKVDLDLDTDDGDGMGVDVDLGIDVTGVIDLTSSTGGEK